MSTRAVYTFKDSANTFHVYKHHDGHPSYASRWIAKSLAYAWDLPRFEASEFACAFIAANKPIKEKNLRGGGIYLTDSYDLHGDLDYRYEITFFNNDLTIYAYKVIAEKPSNNLKYNYDYELIFFGNLDDFLVFAKYPKNENT